MFVAIVTFITAPVKFTFTCQTCWMALPTLSLFTKVVFEIFVVSGLTGLIETVWWVFWIFYLTFTSARNISDIGSIVVISWDKVAI